jgi:isocitrate dehydrogenase
MRWASNGKIQAPPLVYIKGEEMTRYAGRLYLEEWITPYVDTTKWEFFDLSCRSRDDTDDQVLKDTIAAGGRVGAIYKEPTVTPTNDQKEEMGLKKAWGSPNGAMRRGWQGITISRDTIHIEGMRLGYTRPVLFDRHAVGGEYGAAYGIVGKGRAETIFYPEDGEQQLIDSRQLVDDQSAVVVYSNPLDNVTPMAHHFFQRCLDAKVMPCVVTKKTVFKWQEGFWQRMKDVFDTHYKQKFAEAKVEVGPDGDLQHFLSDVATMQLIRWKEGGFGMAAHNYDGDVLTDQLAQIHRSPGFLSSVLTGMDENGFPIKEFEASHGTVTDMWTDHLSGKETSLNPLSMMEALIGAMKHSAVLSKQRGGDVEEADRLIEFADKLQKSIHAQLVSGQPTRDLDKKKGITTEQFVRAVRDRLPAPPPPPPPQDLGPIVIDPLNVDEQAVLDLFASLDADGNGAITVDEFREGIRKLGALPTMPDRKKEKRDADKLERERT